MQKMERVGGVGNDLLRVLKLQRASARERPRLPQVLQFFFF